MSSDLWPWARTVAKAELAVPLPQRWAHWQGVARRAIELEAFRGDNADLLAAAILHDVGYAPRLTTTPGGESTTATDRIRAIVSRYGADSVSTLSEAVMLAETGDPARFTSGRAVVKHAGLNPCEHTSATMNGQTRVSRRGRPALRSAAWRAVWGALRHNRVLAVKHARRSGRDGNRLAGGQARTACAATLLRWLRAVITSGRARDARIAAGEIAVPGRGGAVTCAAAA